MSDDRESHSRTITFSNPAGIAKPMGYSHVAEVAGPCRIIYISGQLGLDATGQLAGASGDFQAQARQVFENLKAALASVGADFDNVIKLNSYFTDIRAQLPIFRGLRDTYLNPAGPPASTAIETSNLAVPGALLEVEAVVVLPMQQGALAVSAKT